MFGRAKNAIIAIGFSLLPLPALRLLDYFNRNCGDGLCGFFSGLLVLGALATVTMMFLVASSRSKETPAILRFIPVLLWSLIFFRLFI